ncbi:ATP-binding protein [Gordonia sp. (in: high G+C Gram-positive bacteria)]|uniref:sensor histidine kinase n=1 Tax=Gordonia sp. (in: high G+C Gram-positive bacteria) TaxID=84139 RepID=UPI0016B13C9A|nr:ATP-binding protein [Gordonia sp. (in: high G+C Gram-positive bacteria)]NLG47889.1 sensor histidine kinase [Gordonia sp. (in: high G+C Gram-positive bacteria)]
MSSRSDDPLRSDDSVAPDTPLEDLVIVDEHRSRPDLLGLIVAHTETGIIAVDEFHNVVLYNKRATDLGMFRDTLADGIAEAVTEVFITGVGRYFDFVPPHSSLGFLSTGRTAPRTVENVRCIARLAVFEGVRYALVFGDDDSTNQRVEATRRDFAANVSHELKTPLGAISLMAEAMLESKDDPEAVDHFGRRVLKEATRMGTLVNELIGLSRLQEGRIPDFTALDVDTLVDDAIAAASVTAEVAQISLVVDAPSHTQVQGDRTLLLTALSNLLINAINHSQSGDVVSVSRKHVTMDDEEMVSIAVTDRGIGIAPADQQRVFERFFRVDKARSRATGGTGLGLAIVKHVAASHGGHIGLWSRPGTGSTFSLYIPIDPTSTSDTGSTNTEELTS